MKRLFFIILACLTIVNAFADRDMHAKDLHKALGDQDVLAAEVMTNIPLNAAGYMGVLNTADGIQEGGMVRNASYFNAEIAKRFKGRHVSAITTAIYWQGVEEAKIWIRKSLDGPDLWSKTCIADEFGRVVDPDANEVIVGEDGSSSVIDYESPISIPCDYMLDGEPIYVGHDLKLRPEYSGIHAYVCSPAYTDGHWWFSPDAESGWQDFTGNGAYIMELTTEAAEGSANGLVMNDASILDVATVRAKCGEKVSGEVTFGYYGRNRLSTIEYEVEINGGTAHFRLEATNPVPYGTVFNLPFEITMPQEAKRHDLTVRVVKVNGEDDAFTDGNEFTGAAVAINTDNEHKRVAVMENFGSLFQSDESYAIRSIENLQEEFGDQFLLIDAHYGQSGLPDNWWTYDPWHCQDYAAQRESLFKIPYCIVNRTFEGDPYYGSEADFLAGRNGIHTVISEVTQQDAEALVEGTATLAADHGSIDVVTNVTFLADVDNAGEYTIGYVITEDGLVGKQRNIYAGNYECFKWFKEMGLPDLPFWWERTFNDVAREASQRYGIPGSLSGNAKAGEPMTYKFALPMPTYYDNMANLNVVMLLIEKKSGEIMAAGKVKVDTTAGISSVASSANNDGYTYNLQGQRINPQTAGQQLIIKNGRKYIIR